MFCATQSPNRAATVFSVPPISVLAPSGRAFCVKISSRSAISVCDRAFLIALCSAVDGGRQPRDSEKSVRRQEASSDAVERADFRLSLADHAAAAKVRCGAKRFAPGGTGLPAFLSGGKKNLVLDGRQQRLCSRIQGRGTRSRVHSPLSGPSASTAEAHPP